MPDEQEDVVKSKRPVTTPTNVLRLEQSHPLEAFFNPKNIAVIGASETEGSVGRSILANLKNNPFGGSIFPVNPKRASVLGIEAYPDLASVPARVDLAVIITPARAVPDVIQACVEKGVQGAIVISAGFKERGTEGQELERRILETAQAGNLRIVGPNCLGIMAPFSGLNATFAGAMAQKGSVAFISQSGALCTAVLDWSLKESVGFSAFVSVGSMLDVGWGDLITYLGDDPHTKSIVLYMETIGDARAFMSAAREVAFTKPIIVIKAGRTQEAAQAAASHTGALAGSVEVLDAAFRRCGVLAVSTIAELFYMAEVLGKQPRPRGPRLTILTNAGGPGVLATDRLIGGGGQLAPLPSDTLEAFNGLLPEHWSHNNPVDILGDAGPERYAKSLEIAAKNPQSDGLLVIVTPQEMTDPTRTAEQLKSYALSTGKPVLASWMGGAQVAAGEAILSQAGIPTFPYPDTAAQVFNYMWRYTANLRNLYETPTLVETQPGTTDPARAISLINSVRQAGRTLLTEAESKELLAAYGIPTVATLIAETEAEAIEHSDKLGYPVVLKIYSQTITHKTDVGGVRLNLQDATAVKQAYQAIADAVREKVGPEHFQGVTVQPMIKLEGYELIIGSSLDLQFGPVLLFGSGGQLVEVYQDRALALPPLNTTLARRMMEQTRIFKALLGVRGRPPVNLAALEQLMVRFSQLVTEQRWIKEIDINPLLASHEGLVALDARVVLHGTDVHEAELPKLAIRPYPNRYVQAWTMKNGGPVIIRPIRPEDEPLMVKFHETLSERSVYFRWLHMIHLSQRTAHERLTRICFIDYAREMALVADYTDPQTGQHLLLGVGRLSKIYGTDEAEFAVLISDQWQGQGLGTELLRRLVEVGRNDKVGRIVGFILPENRDMQRVSEKLGFRHFYSIEDGLVKVELDL